MMKDYSISFTRFFAMILIIVCHIMQYFNNELAWWFNVGVQMFLFISGYLYSTKKITSTKQFYKKEFTKILVPYYIYLSFVIIFYNIIKKDSIVLVAVIKSIFLIDTLSGIEHLWFVRLIIFCYLLTPLYKMIIEKCTKPLTSFFSLIIIVLLNELIGLTTNNFINGTWLSCFVVGLFYGKNKEVLNNKINYIILFVVTIITLTFQIVIQYVLNIKFSGIFNMIFNKYCNYVHLFLGIFWVITFIFIYKKITGSAQKKRIFLDLSDSYSYYIYITHHIFILGSYSIYNYVDSILLSTIAILFLTIVFSIGLRLLNEKIIKLLYKY